MIKNFFIGSKDGLDTNDIKELVGILQSPPVQKEFCDYLHHTRIYMKARQPRPAFNGTVCDIKIEVEDYINHMSVQYGKGRFILAAKFNSTYNYELYPDVGTDIGICKTVKPMVDFNPSLPTPREKQNYVIPKGSDVMSGEKNGLTLHLDLEEYDHGYTPSIGAGASLVVIHHGDQPLLGLGKIKLMPGTDTDVTIVPTVTTTTNNAMNSFTSQERECYFCNETSLLFLPYTKNKTETCEQVGFRFSISNCMFEAALEAVLDHCHCFPAFHGEHFNAFRMRNPSLVASMPYIHKELSTYHTCKADGLYCSTRIFDRISNYQTIYDPYQRQSKNCHASCNDQQHAVQTTTSSYPAEPVFQHNKDYCLLLLKFVEQCKVTERRELLDEYYPWICKSVTNMTGAMIDTFKILKLDTKMLESESVDLEMFRGRLVDTFCDEDKIENWVDIVDKASPKFKSDMYSYGQKNLVRVNVFIRNPFVTSFERDVKTSPISFIANIGGLMGLCMGFSFVSLAEIIYYLVLGAWAAIRGCVTTKRKVVDETM